MRRTMATLVLHHDGTTRALQLPACAIVGRAAGCALRIDDRSVPMHWLEIRWSPRGWRWRALAGETRTRGVGALQEDGWRQLPESVPARPQRLRYADALALELVDGGPPERFLVDLQSGACLRGDDLSEVVEVRPHALLRVDAAGDPVGPLRDGDVVVRGDRAWRVHLAETPEPTLHVRVDLTRPNASVDVLDEGFRAIFHQDGAEVTLSGEHVRTLAVYAEARRADTPRGGWLGVTEAWTRWVAMGGNPESSAERIAWDRARCRTYLARAGVGGLEALFETRRIGGAPHYRLGIAVE